MGFRFEFEPVHKILLARFEGRLTDKSLGEFYRAGLKHWAATDARAAISDYTSAEWAVSAKFVRELANWEPDVAEPVKRPRIVVAPSTVGFGLARMFQIVGERKRPLLQVVRTMEEALAALGIESPHFEPLE
jgi:hypothetical protein